jgi:hypothetical protein
MQSTGNNSTWSFITACVAIATFPSLAAAMLHPELGRFAQRDPAGYLSASSLYTYVTSAPVARADPMGLVDDQTLLDLIAQLCDPDYAKRSSAQAQLYKLVATDPTAYVQLIRLWIDSGAFLDSLCPEQDVRMDHLMLEHWVYVEPASLLLDIGEEQDVNIYWFPGGLPKTWLQFAVGDEKVATVKPLSPMVFFKGGSTTLKVKGVGEGETNLGVLKEWRPEDGWNPAAWDSAQVEICVDDVF